jgi:hypothetical protein
MDRPRKNFFTTPSGWAMIFCVAGVCALFFPWLTPTGILGRVKLEHGDVGWALQVQQKGSQNALASWHGIPTGIVFVLLFLLMVATSPLNPVPFWRTLVLLVGGFLVVLFTSMFVGRFVGMEFVAVAGGAYLALGLGFGLLFLGALEIRGMLIQRAEKARHFAPLAPQIIPEREMDEKLRESIKPAEENERGM